MENKTAEEMMNTTISEYNDIVPNLYKFKFNNKENEMFVALMKSYAEQEVKKHLDIAAENAKVLEHTSYSETKTFNKVEFKSNTKNMKGIVHTTSVLKESITEIKIDLT